MKIILFLVFCLFAIPSIAYDDTTAQVVTMLMLTDDMSNNNVKSTEANQQITKEKENDLKAILIAISFSLAVCVLSLGIEAIDEAYNKKHRRI